MSTHCELEKCNIIAFGGVSYTYPINTYFQVSPNFIVYFNFVSEYARYLPNSIQEIVSCMSSHAANDA